MSSIILKTPLEICKRLSQKYNCKIYFKREDLQTVRSFKIRGAYNKIVKCIKNNNNNGFVTASAGNHAQGVAHVCKKLGLDGHIFVPETTPLQKISRIEYFGGNNCKLYRVGANFDECLEESNNFCTKYNKTFIHPFDDLDIIEGQSNIFNEILTDIEPDIVICPIGGGGLISGAINVLNNTNNTNTTNNICDIYGVEPRGANSMYQSLQANRIVEIDNIDTFVDGASVRKVGNLTFEISKNVKDIFTIDKGHICHEMIELYQNEGIIAEPAGALSICGISNINLEELTNKNVVCILSGGNNDLMRYPEIVEYRLRFLKLKHYFIVNFRQKPGELKKFVEEVLVKDTDITRFEYIKKNNKDAGSVLLGIEVKEPKQIEEIKANMNNNLFEYIELKENDLLYSYLL